MIPCVTVGFIKTTEKELWAGDQCYPDLQTLFRDRDSSLSLTTAFILTKCWLSLNVFLNTVLDVPYHPSHSQAKNREVFLFCFSLGKLSLGIFILQLLLSPSWKFSASYPCSSGSSCYSGSDTEPDRFLWKYVCLGSKLFCMFIREVKPRLHWCWASTLLLRFTPGFLAIAYLSMPVPISSLHTEW